MATQQNLDLLFQVRVLAGQFFWSKVVLNYERIKNNYFGGG